MICDSAHNRVTSISLSGKNLTGYVPSEIGALASLAFLDLSRNSFGGPLPHQIANLQSLVHLDISSNNFSGSLPQGLINLANLRGTLNLSCNSFSGEIPASFGKLPMTVSLDLRRNNLSGEIPQVGSLLNQGPTAFSGNPFLCGFPTNTLCAEAETGNIPINPRKPEISSKNGEMKSGMVTVSVICGVSVAAMGMVFVSVWLVKRRWKMEEKMDASMGDKGQKGKFVVVDEGFGLELEDLLRASAYVLGKSRSGIVYKVVLPGGVAATVRRLGEAASWRLKEFEAIAKVRRHPNLVSLKAYYYATDEKLVVEDFIGNGSLHNALHGSMSGNGMPPLSWAARLRIAQEAARGLMHIHECSSRKQVHGSIKTSKILLDHDLKPYISGFGLPRLVFTQKCDVYSFGVVLLEILTGRLQEEESLVRRAFREERPLSEIIDPSLLHQLRPKKQILAMFHIALSCTEMEPHLRPKMRMVSYTLDCIKLE
ncbi:probable inactive leucine-rich repeat receptor-like protein kinase At1g66830 [Salvia miltiorrhiza]|uniref:probable inactive leucine-rich repeat receptor-like protein kinase At1g66830 n=1 Tax=Salvia miltiorrhiza TaxID=226208 RepID=UPI0025ACF6E4|nr:probable inactive leucine-rich repeat receptor-like protein kinase At1g66830 [Salvia miltiorrhiza]